MEPLAVKPLIVACTDFSPCSEEALRRAASMAIRDGHRVLLFHGCEPHRGSEKGFDAESMHDLREARQKHFGAMSDNDVQYDAVPSGQAAKAICKAARDHHASLIVLGSHGRTGVWRQVLGSVAEHVVRQAPCSVLVVRGESNRT